MGRRRGRRRRLGLRLRSSGHRSIWQLEGCISPPDAGRFTEPCSPDGKAHRHALHRIVCVLGGQGLLFTMGGCFAVRSTDVFVLPPGVPHGLSGRGRRPLSVCAVDFHGAAVLSGAEHGMLECVFSGTPVIRCSRAAARETLRLVHLVRAEQRHGRQSAAMAVRAYLVALLVLLHRRRQRIDAGGEPRVEPVLAQARRRMEERLNEPCRVGELADLAHLSPRQFTVRFKRAFGVTPLQYRTRLRVATAQDLLRRSDRGVAAIAREVGYQNLSHFYRTFTQHTGMSPGRFRAGGHDPGDGGPAAAT